ncbi:hypothetical protein ABFS82_01G008900 [Erythranthe guttata]
MISDNATTTPDDKIIPFSPSRRKAATTATSSRGFCRRLSDCIVMGPAATSNRVKIERRTIEFDQRSHDQVLKVEEIEREVQKEREMKGMYKARLEKTQVFLKYCLQVAQENGFLDLMLNNNDNKNHDYFSLSPSTISSPPPPSPPQSHPHLAPLIHQAKVNGWYIHPQEIEMIHLSAQGSTADIYRGKWRGVHVAVKCMYPDFFQSNENGVIFFGQEVETLSKQRHPFVLQLIGACLDPPDNCWIVTEFLATNLKDWLHGPGKRNKERKIPVPPLKDRIEKALEISQAMQYLHESKPKILHRDLKPSNIFLDDALHVRVADFGHARYLTDGEKALTGETGTFVYMAPEVIQCGPYDEKCDVYSFGVILNELMSGEHPYIHTDFGPSKIALEVAENGLRPRIAELDDELIEVVINDLIKRSWDQDPTARPGFSDITSILRVTHNRLYHGKKKKTNRERI